MAFDRTVFIKAFKELRNNKHIDGRRMEHLPEEPQRFWLHNRLSRDALKVRYSIIKTHRTQSSMGLLLSLAL